MKKIFLFLLCTLGTSLLPLTSVSAEDVTGIAQLAQCSGTDCSACNLVHMANGLIKWLIGILFILFAVLMAIAGVKLVTSGGNSSALNAAKSSFTNAIIGFIIVLSAWLIVDTIMRGLVGNEGRLDNGGAVSGWLFWSKIECQEQTVAQENEWVEPVGNDFGPGGSFYGGVEGPVPEYVADPTADGSFTYQSGIAAQRGHASAALNSMLNCMASRVPAGVGNISSISDSRIVGGMTFAQCAAGGCNHAANSRHYGGSSCTGQSYAVDFGDEQNVSALCRAANTCGLVNTCSVHNGNHVHLDLPLTCR